MPNLLKNNAYHILGLDASSSQKDILKRSKDIIKFIQIDDLPHYDLDLDVFENFRTEDSVKESIQKLTSPKKQIKEYFFWFNIADQVDEQAVGILRLKKPEDAILVWEHHTQGDSIKELFYKKNLAVLYCLLLFKEDNQHYLDESLKLWNEIINSKKFWGAFSKIYKLNDELYTNQETIDNFEKNCASYLSDLYSEIAASRNDNRYVSSFSVIFNTKGEKTSKNLLAPIFDEMTSATEKLEAMKVSEDGILDKEESQEIKSNIEKIQSGCNKLMELGLYEDSQSRLIRDRASKALRSISIDLHNNLDETSVALGLSKIADKLSGTDGLKNIIKQDLNQLEENEKFKANEERIKVVIDPILNDYQNGNADRAIKTINDYIYSDKTDEVLKTHLKELKEAMEEKMAKHGKPGSPSMGTLNTVGLKMYGDTLYFVALFVPLIPISRWSCVDNGNNTYTFYGQLELTKNQKIWRNVAIGIIIVLVLWAIIANN